MKSLITAAILSTSLIASSAFAFDLETAKNICPTLDSMKFSPLNPGTSHSKGKITGVKNNTNFTSYNNTTNPATPYVIQPEDKDNPSFYWRSVGTNNYGHISRDVTTCFYSYTGFTGVTVNLIMNNKPIKLFN